MKYLVNLLAVLVFAGCLAQAPVAEAWWSVEGDVQVRRTYIQVTVYNNHDRPIYCVMTVYGETSSGHVLQNRDSWVIPPGEYAYTGVKTRPRNPFVRGWGDGRCRWR